MKKNRRKFLKLLMLGTGALFLGKIVGSRGPIFTDSKNIKRKEMGNFEVVESENHLEFFNEREEKVFVLHKDGTLEV
jgi:hypothetical protein